LPPSRVDFSLFAMSVDSPATPVEGPPSTSIHADALAIFAATTIVKILGGAL
jgi:hypothetical protein